MYVSSLILFQDLLMIALPFRKTHEKAESRVPSPSSSRMWSMMAAPPRMTPMGNIGAPLTPIVPTTMLMAKATGGIAQKTAGQPLLEKACAVKASLAHPAARTRQNWIPEQGENVEVACIAAVKVNYGKYAEYFIYFRINSNCISS